MTIACGFAVGSVMVVLVPRPIASYPKDAASAGAPTEWNC
jgi:hypothetical protein